VSSFSCLRRFIVSSSALIAASMHERRWSASERVAHGESNSRATEGAPVTPRDGRVWIHRSTVLLHAQRARSDTKCSWRLTIFSRIPPSLGVTGASFGPPREFGFTVRYTF